MNTEHVAAWGMLLKLEFYADPQNRLKRPFFSNNIDGNALKHLADASSTALHDTLHFSEADRTSILRGIEILAKVGYNVHQPMLQIRAGRTMGRRHDNEVRLQVRNAIID